MNVLQIIITQNDSIIIKVGTQPSLIFNYISEFFDFSAVNGDQDCTVNLSLNLNLLNL